MPVVTQIVCDGCQAVKKKVNHWYALTTNEQGALLQPLDHALYNPGEAKAPSQKQYFCGRRCALEAFGIWMDELQSNDSLSRVPYSS